MKKLPSVIAALATAMMVATAAYGFQETQGGSAPGVTPPTVPNAGAAGLTTKVPEKPSEGLEIRLPMLGVIGKLPKLDFGMELLYGADDQQKQQLVDPNAQGNPTVEDGNLTIRGTLRHKF